METLRPLLTRTSFVRDQILVDYGQLGDHALFIEQGVISVLSAPTQNEAGIQVAMIGPEGVAGRSWDFSGAHPATIRMVAVTPGSAWRMAAADWCAVLPRCAALQTGCAQFSQSLIAQIMDTAASNAHRTLAERCARWLVMMCERVESREVRVTHEALAVMLGMRRSGVTVAAAALQSAGMIRTGRGRFVITNLGRLQAFSQGDVAALRAAPSRVDTLGAAA